MPKRIVPLSDMKVQKAKPKNKPVTLFDGGGLFLMVTPSGGKLWRFKYRYDGKPKLLAFGAYPAISLLDARRKRDDATAEDKLLVKSSKEKNASETFPLPTSADEINTIIRDVIAITYPNGEGIKNKNNLHVLNKKEINKREA